MVATLTGGHNVFPSVFTALASWDDMVESHGGSAGAAVLAGVAVSLEDFAAGEFASVKGLADHVDEADHLGAFKHPGYGVDVLDTALNRFGFSFAK